MDPLGWLQTAQQDRMTAGLTRRRRLQQPLSPGLCVVDGRVLRNFASNDYLALSVHPAVRAAACEALEAGTVGATASPVVCGRGPEMLRLEEALCAFEQQPAAIVFPTGMAANIGTLAALVEPEDRIFCDRLNHASLVDGCRLSGASLRVFRHTELDRLRRALSRSPAAQRTWIVTDSVFSMDGDVAPLVELTDLADEFGAILVVDEAHGTGVFGATGRGVCEAQHLEHRVAIRIGTLSKALGGLGGFVAGSETLIDHLWHRARTLVYSTALPPAMCAASAAAVNWLKGHPELVTELAERCHQLRQLLAERDLRPRLDSRGPIVPLVLGASEATMQAAKGLEERGFFVGAIRPPTVPAGTARLRITVSLHHDLAALTALADALRDVIPLTIGTNV